MNCLFKATPLSIDENVFQYVNIAGSTLKVPSGAVSTYQSADVWKHFGTITEL